jgi:hypothetical protein
MRAHVTTCLHFRAAKNVFLTIRHIDRCVMHLKRRATSMTRILRLRLKRALAAAWQRRRGVARGQIVPGVGSGTSLPLMKVRWPSLDETM